MEIYKDITFEAAHLLPNLPDDHKCRRLHGHSFKVRITLDGPIQENVGWVEDFSDIKKAFQPIYDQLDHRYLNDIEGLDNPTSENLAKWIWEKIVNKLEEFENLFLTAKQEAKKFFGNDEVYIEKFFQNPRHIEVQVLSGKNRTVHLHERDCSVQRLSLIHI